MKKLTQTIFYLHLSYINKRVITTDKFKIIDSLFKKYEIYQLKCL